MDSHRMTARAPRPAGAGPFSDYATAFTQLHSAKLDALSAQLRRKERANALRQGDDGAQQRWDAEGGKTTSTTRR
jgi:hypothetical protein